MSHYLAATLSLLLLVTISLTGWEAIRLLDARRAVETSLLEGQSHLMSDGGLSLAARRRLLDRMREQGIDSGRATVEGSPAGQPTGTPVWLAVRYRHRLFWLLPGAWGRWEGERWEIPLMARAVAISTYRP